MTDTATCLPSFVTCVVRARSSSGLGVRLEQLGEQEVDRLAEDLVLVPAVHGSARPAFHEVMSPSGPMAMIASFEWSTIAASSARST